MLETPAGDAGPHLRGRAAPSSLSACGSAHERLAGTLSHAYDRARGPSDRRRRRRLQPLRAHQRLPAPPARQTAPHRVIIVDNGSTDDTPIRLAGEWPHVHVERFDENRSYTTACNRGVAAGSAEIVVLLNNDVTCRPDFLERLVAPMQDPAVASVASLVLQADERSIDSVGITADVTLAGFQRLHGMPLGRAQQHRPLLTGAEGTAGAYRRRAWEQVQGMDETIPAYMETFDLALRLRLAGWTTACAPEAIAVHLGLDDLRLQVAPAAPARGLQPRLPAAPLRGAAHARRRPRSAHGEPRRHRGRRALARPRGAARARRGLARRTRPGASSVASRRGDRLRHRLLGLAGASTRGLCGSRAH